MTSDRNDRTLKLVSAAYGVAIKPEKFEELLAAWDAWCDSVVEGSEDAFEEVSAVFGEALQVSSHLNDSMPKDPLEQAPVPTVLLDDQDQIVAMNTAGKALFADEGLDAAVVLATRQPTAGGAHRTFRLAGGAAQRSYLAIETGISKAMRDAHPAARSALFLSLMDWTDGFGRSLGQQLDLSAAELRVARGLLEGRTAQEIAGELGRSLATVRSHIKALLTKTGARRQTELVQFLTILRQVSEEGRGPGAVSGSADWETITLTGPAGRLRVVRYGAGRPLIYFTTSSCPEETKAVRRALASAGFAVYAPIRPGFRDSNPVQGDASDAMLTHWLDPLLALVGPKPLIIGHREGGILAARAAAQIGSVAGLVLVSTGAPVRDLERFQEAPDSIRRSFVSAHVAAPALRLGYQAAARLFRASTAGQNQIIRFFHRDSPADKRRLNDPDFRETTRALLDYCFDDPDQIVRDIAVWGSDWSDVLDSVLQTSPVLFVHGSEHAFHPMAEIEALTMHAENASLLALQDAGQMALYEHPSAIADALRKLIESPC